MRAVIVVGLALVFASSALAATPKAWQWAPAHASSVVHGTCVGVGSKTSGHYTSFRCVVGKTVVWGKVRHSGSGKLCTSRVSLAKVSAVCLKVPVKVKPPPQPTVNAWEWTTTQASAALIANSATIFDPHDAVVKSATCEGVAPGANGRFTTFKCLAKVSPVGDSSTYDWTIWAGIRKQGSGAICLGKKTLDAVPADCLSLR